MPVKNPTIGSGAKRLYAFGLALKAILVGGCGSTGPVINDTQTSLDLAIVEGPQRLSCEGEQATFQVQSPCWGSMRVFIGTDTMEPRSGNLLPSKPGHEIHEMRVNTPARSPGPAELEIDCSAAGSRYQTPHAKWKIEFFATLPLYSPVPDNGGLVHDAKRIGVEIYRGRIVAASITEDNVRYDGRAEPFEVTAGFFNPNVPPDSAINIVVSPTQPVTIGHHVVEIGSPTLPLRTVSGLDTWYSWSFDVVASP